RRLVRLAPLLWPLAALALAALIPGLPSLSHRPRFAPRWIATPAPVAAVAALLARRAAPAPALVLARAGPTPALPLAPPLLSGVPAALAGGAPARMPWWTGELLFWLGQLGGALVATGAALLPAALRPGSGHLTLRRQPRDVR